MKPYSMAPTTVLIPLISPTAAISASQESVLALPSLRRPA